MERLRTGIAMRRRGEAEELEGICDLALAYRLDEADLLDYGTAIHRDRDTKLPEKLIRPGGEGTPSVSEAAALLAPFDPLVWYRPRALRLFGFHYRISIYTPAAQREHGYYVLPVLVDDELVGRVDLKSDRQAGVLRVRHAHVEPDVAHRAVDLAARVAPLLHEAAAWQGLGDVRVEGVGAEAIDGLGGQA